MFTNIGTKIKTTAKVFAWVGIILSVLAGVALTMSAGFIGGIWVAIVGSLLSWVGSLALYGFGELVENSDIRTNLAVKADRQKNA
ncbi:MAG: hypothetical protein ACI4MM_09295 [Candidatus Ventricola sp.]